MLFGKFDPDSGTAGLGPLRWQSSKNIKAKDGHDSCMLRIGISHWALALLLLILPMLALNRIRKSRRFRKLGLCPACGYDLRATTDRCPECGAIAHHRNS
jgi:hypothetical protein